MVLVVDGSCFGVAVGSKKFEYGSGMIWAGFPSFFGLGLEDSHIPTCWLLLQVALCFGL